MYIHAAPRRDNAWRSLAATLTGTANIKTSSSLRQRRVAGSQHHGDQSRQRWVAGRPGNAQIPTAAVDGETDGVGPRVRPRSSRGGRAVEEARLVGERGDLLPLRMVELIELHDLRLVAAWENGQGRPRCRSPVLEVLRHHARKPSSLLFSFAGVRLRGLAA